MILRFYRTNQPAVLLSLPLTGLIIWLLFFIFPYPSHSEPNISLFFNITLDQVPGWVWKLTQLALVLVEAILFNRILNDFELFEKSSFVPAFVYICCAALFIPDGTLQSSSLINYFLLQALHTLFGIYRQNSCKEEAFVSGFLFGTGILIYWPIAAIILFGWIAFSLQKAFYWREWLLLPIGALTPLLFYEAIHFAIYNSVFSPFYLGNAFHFEYLIWGEQSVAEYLFWMVAALSVISFLIFLSKMRGTIMKTRKQRSVLIYFSIILTAIFILSNGFLTGNGLPILVIPISIVLSFGLVHSSIKWMTDLIFYCILIAFALLKIGPFSVFA